MQRSDFFYELPEELIAYFPTQERSQSRLLTVSTRDCGQSYIQSSVQFEQKIFCNILEHIQENDLLVLNNTKVIPARLFGKKTTGGQVEILVEKILDDCLVLAHVKASKSPKENSQIIIEINEQAIEVDVLGRENSLFKLSFPSDMNVWKVMEQVGHMPLPPYIKREDELADQNRYQTVYAQKPGAVAAPTAGLHFDDALLADIKAKGCNVGYVTLHVGAGTFQPVRVDNITEHHMHSERIVVDESLCEQIKQTRAKGGRVIAVGTTVVRCLESAADENGVQPFEGETDIFIYPGYRFKAIDLLITNFHLPESTLLMLVSAFAGFDTIKNAYAYAIENKFRFFSYGDAMLLQPPEYSLHFNNKL